MAACVKTKNVKYPVCIPTEPRIGKQMHNKDIKKKLC